MYFKERHLRELTNRILLPTRDLTYCVITGIAGSGKTELARHYVIDYVRQNPTTFAWRLDPDSSSDLQISYQSAYRGLLQNFYLKESDLTSDGSSSVSSSTLLHLLWQRIDQYPEWILIFDNAVSDQDIQPYLPPRAKKGLILITTQNSNFFVLNTRIKFYPLSLNAGLDPAEAVQLLNEMSQREEGESNALDLVNKLDRLPLGVLVAGGYIRITEISFTKYIQEMERNLHFMEVQIQQRDPQMWSRLVNEEDRHKNLTLQSAIRQLVLEIQKHKSVLYQLMEYCGYLNNEAISRDLVIRLYKEIMESKEGDLSRWWRHRLGENPVTEDVETGLNILTMGTENYSLITYEPKNQSYKVHRTTQMVMRGLCKDPVQKIKKLVAIMIDLYNWDWTTIWEVEKCQKMEPHVVTLSQYISTQVKKNRGLQKEQKQINEILGHLMMSQLRSKNPDSKLLRDRNFVLQAVERRGEVLRVVSEELQKDEEIVVAAVRQNGLMLEYAGERVRNDKEIVLAAVRQQGLILEYAGEGLRNDKEIVLVAVVQDGRALQYASPELQNDKAIVLAAITQNRSALRYASQELKKDKEVLLAVVKQSGLALEFRSKEMKTEFASTQMKQRRRILAPDTRKPNMYYENKEVQMHNRDIVLAAVQRDPLDLRRASPKLQNDKDIVLAAVQRWGWVLQFASLALRNDREVVLAAVVQDGNALEFASRELKNDKELVLAAIQSGNGWVLQFASLALRNDREVVLAAIQSGIGWVLQFASLALRNDREVVLAAIQSGIGWVLQFASLALRNDREVVLAAVVQDGNALEFASRELKNDKELVLAAIQGSNGSALGGASPELRNDKAFVLTAVVQERLALYYASPGLQQDPEVVKAAKA